MEWRSWLTRAFGFGLEIGSDRVVGIGDRGGEVVTSRLPFVTPHLARCLPVVFACDRVIAEAMATSTPRLMRGDTPVPSHPILDVFRHPGPFESLSELLATAQSDLDMWGNCYLLPLRTRAGTLVEFEYLSASAMAVYGDTRRDDGSRVIEYHHEDLGTLRRERGSPPPLLHVRQNRPGYDSWIGKSAIRFMRESVSAGLSSVEFHARQMLEGGHSQLALTTDQELDPETIQQNADAFNAATKGPRRWFATPFLPRGITPVPLALSNEDLQFIDLHKLTREDLCGVMRVPAPLVGDLSKATYSNLKQLIRHLNRLTLAPQIAFWSGAIARDLLFDEPDLRLTFVPDERADQMEQIAVVTQAIAAGILTPRDGGRMMGWIYPEAHEPSDEYRQPKGIGPPPKLGNT